MNKLIKTLFGFFLFFQMSSFAKQLPYDFSDTFYIPIELHIIEEISTKQGFLIRSATFLRCNLAMNFTSLPH